MVLSPIADVMIGVCGVLLNEYRTVSEENGITAFNVMLPLQKPHSVGFTDVTMMPGGGGGPANV
jgi:hypothetical protein